jgi:hypothetical protein
MPKEDDERDDEEEEEEEEEAPVAVEEDDDEAVEGPLKFEEERWFAEASGPPPGATDSGPMPSLPWELAACSRGELGCFALPPWKT